MQGGRRQGRRPRVIVACRDQNMEAGRTQPIDQRKESCDFAGYRAMQPGDASIGPGERRPAEPLPNARAILARSRARRNRARQPRTNGASGARPALQAR